MAGELKNGDKPAFPFHPYRPHDDESANGYQGLTKREQIAAMAMQGLLAGNYSYLYGNQDVPVSSEIAKRSIECADELLKQLQETDK